MTALDQKIQQKKLEIETLTKLLDNARKDLRALETLKKAEEKKV